MTDVEAAAPVAQVRALWAARRERTRRPKCPRRQGLATSEANGGPTELYKAAPMGRAAIKSMYRPVTAPSKPRPRVPRAPQEVKPSGPVKIGYKTFQTSAEAISYCQKIVSEFPEVRMSPKGRVRARIGPPDEARKRLLWGGGEPAGGGGEPGGAAAPASAGADAAAPTARRTPPGRRTRTSTTTSSRCSRTP